MKLKKTLEASPQKEMDKEKRLAILEIKLYRVYKHFNSEKYPVGIITAFRGGADPTGAYEQNVNNNIQLASELRQAGYGYVIIDGGWKKTTKDGGIKEIEEVSIMVIGGVNDDGKLHDLLLQKAKKYGQDGVLFKPEGETFIYIIDHSGKKEKISNKFNLDKVSIGYTKLRGRVKGKVFSFHEERGSGSWIVNRIKYERLKKLEEAKSKTDKS